jgi:hydrogenase-4 membrane subunit HyfE
VITTIVKREKRKTARNTVEPVAHAIISANGIDVIIVPDISIILITSLLIDWIMRRRTQEQSRIFKTEKINIYSHLTRIERLLGLLYQLH